MRTFAVSLALLSRFASSIALGGACLLLAACSGVPEVPDSVLQHGSRQPVTADWNDIDAAVDVGASIAEMAIVSMGTDDEGRRVYRLRTVRDEPAWLVVRRTGSADESTPLELVARVGAFGDGAREAALLRAVQRRLSKLHGVATSPIE